MRGTYLFTQLGEQIVVIFIKWAYSVLGEIVFKSETFFALK